MGSQGRPTPADWERLGKAIEDRRFRLDLSQEALVKHGGPSHQIVRNVEKAVPADYRTTTFRKFDRALQWRDGTTQKILDGTATDEEIDEVVRRVHGGDSAVGRDFGTVHDKSGGAAGVGAGGGSQTIYPKSIPSETRVGEPMVHVGNLTPQERAEQLAHLETLDDDRAIFELSNRLVPILARRSSSERGSLGPSARTAVTALLDVMKELVDPLYGDRDRKDEQ